MLRIESLEIDDPILEKIESKHGITFDEVEQACLNETLHLRRTREGLYLAFSQTSAGRYVLVVLVHLGGTNWKLVTAREMSESERQLYKKARGG